MAPAVILSAAGVLLVSVAFAVGRHGVPYATIVYWGGQALVFVPVVARVLRGGLRERSAFGLAIWPALTGCLVEWAGSPDRSRFGDELRHSSGTSHFPGLSEMGAAVTSMTRLPLTASAYLVAGVLHLAVVGAIFVLVRRCGGGPTTAALTCVVYAAGQHLLSTHAYQTAALPFLVLALWAARGGPVWVGVVAIAVTTVTHQVSALVLVAALLLVAVTTAVTLSPAAPREIARRTGQLAAIAVVGVGVWLVFVAPEASGYLWQPLADFVTHPRSALTASRPTWILTIQAAGIVGLGIAFVLGVRAAIRWRIRDPWQIATLLAASLFFIGVLLRIVSSGPEVAARAATFTYLPVAAVTAAVVLGRRARVAGFALILVLALGARLPGPSRPADAPLPHAQQPVAIHGHKVEAPCRS